jgi:hypothetical protein
MRQKYDSGSNERAAKLVLPLKAGVQMFQNRSLVLMLIALEAAVLSSAVALMLFGSR